MSPLTRRALSGYALVGSAVACLAGGMLHPVVDGHAHSVEALAVDRAPLALGLILVGTLLLIVGLPGVYGWLAPRLGRLGLVGFGLYLVGNLMSALPHLVVEGLVAPEVAERAPDLISPDDMIIDAPGFVAEQIVSGVALMVGLLLIGVALLRSHVVPRWIGVTAVAGAVLLMVPLPQAPVLTGLQVELARGVVVAALGVLAVRSTRVTRHRDAREPVAA